ncbi:cation:proton antiporter [Pararhodobacter oceanensis]|uniref:cation:proton antiporter n=1 Tax=Pararhodobacter oceanensis TaxID=2172121 RepID=UPI003A93E306
MAAGTVSGLTPVEAIALVGVLGVGAQWLAFRLNLPAIVLMLGAGLIVGPVLGIFDPARDLGALTGPLISVAVAIILFEGGMTLNLHGLRDAAKGVKRLVLVGAPLGWLTSALALHYGAGLSWATASVFGGVMIVTGPTVIAPILRQARLARRPAALLQWEAIVNDPIGALAAVLAFEVVVVLNTAPATAESTAWHMVLGILLALALGLIAGLAIAWIFRRALVPEYMKVPVLFVTVLAVFALPNGYLHESGLLAVTVMGLVIANAKLPSFVELRRFKEHATVLLVSGVFILLAAGLDVEQVLALDWRAALFVALVVLVARPLTVLLSLAFSGVPWRERLFVAFTGPRGVVLVAVAGLFGERLVAVGIADGAQVGALAFLLVAVTVVVHGFGTKPLARALGLIAAETPGVLLVGGSRFSVALAQALEKLGVPVLITDINIRRLRRARSEGIDIFYGDILSEAAERSVELVGFGTILAVTDNDSHNTLVATDLAPEFGRESVLQLSRDHEDSKRRALPVSLGGRRLAGDLTYDVIDQRMIEGHKVRVTRLTEEYTLADWQAARPDAMVLAILPPDGTLKFTGGKPLEKAAKGTRIIALAKEVADKEDNDKELAEKELAEREGNVVADAEQAEVLKTEAEEDAPSATGSNSGSASGSKTGPNTGGTARDN